MTNHRPVTYTCKGGFACVISIPGNPSLIHNGSVSVYSGMLLPTQCVEVERILKDNEVRFTRNGHHDDPDTTRIKQAMKDIQMQPEDAWPCGQCPLCPWFDPLTSMSKPCGFESWSPEVVEEARTMHQQALADCPIHGSK